ncbi:cyclic pyranopterin monophosphate synthase subunit MoaC [Filimonas lacunae]|uniref:Molybdopterin adenylyltransferase n=1 Tax=Filimonas lacunae TaxID=477680 RepID=A0A173MGE2_9BACT|nr:bifunctional molybdenum cofactor biosynthesis protein MoaC/MoaB [Filimonas lacunae]BAV06550.1 molybdenum cofactor biosynthesis protein [Filimonas lacunae]SIT27355.1 cyclic pyranopterin monophosphate synthase subunit MoaC [Filimonas lacunae]
MVNITHKLYSLRKATAMAIVTVSREATIAAVREKQIPKGDVCEFARVAALFAIKKTSEVIPDCHPLPVEYASVNFHITGLQIHITVEVHTVYRTGVEVEAMHGAAIAALTLYDMLKPVDDYIIISSITPSKKEGGKSSFAAAPATVTCAVIVCSDSIAAQTKQDTAGKAILSVLEQHGLQAGFYGVIPDEFDIIQRTALQLSESGYQLLLFTGGTGLSPRDVTPEAIAPLLSRPIPGIMEAARQYGQERTPYAMLSRGVAGFLKDTLIITLPGSTRGAEETMLALFPYVLHLFKVAKGARHDKE